MMEGTPGECLFETVGHLTGFEGREKRKCQESGKTL